MPMQCVHLRIPPSVRNNIIGAKGFSINPSKNALYILMYAISKREEWFKGYRLGINDIFNVHKKVARYYIKPIVQSFYIK